MHLRISIILSLSLASLAAQDARSCINQGVQQFKAERYRDAVESFQKAVQLEPGNVTARLYLGSAWMSQYIPGADSPDNLGIAHHAEAEFKRALEIDPNNSTALASMASLTFQEAHGIRDPEQKSRHFDEAAAWWEKLVAVDPNNKKAYYSLGVIDWEKWYSAWVQIRAGLGMRPDQPGPMPDPARQQLKQQYSGIIDQGIVSLQKALQLDPRDDDAMAYMNLLIRERADLADTPEQYRREIETADEWVQRALETKKTKPESADASTSPAPVLQPNNPPQRLSINGLVQEASLIHKVDPLYPPLAVQARIQGTVRFTAIIGRDGRVQNLQLISGHPILVQAARRAASQWEYKPALVNGTPMEVVTQVDVNFTLPQ